MFANDAIYSSANVVEREDNTGFQAKGKKVLHYTNKFEEYFNNLTWYKR